MKITRVISRVVRRDMGGRLWNPRTRWQEKVMVLVFLETDTGHCDSIEYHMLHQWLWDLVPAGMFAPRQGYVRPPSGPGLGLALTPDDV